jgi:hypothetical protein
MGRLEGGRRTAPTKMRVGAPDVNGGRRSARCMNKVKNPCAPTATRVIELGECASLAHRFGRDG